MEGYVFRIGDDGVGYHADVPPCLPLDLLVKPDEYHLYRFSAAQWQAVASHAENIKRARRQRLANGKRKKKTTRRQIPIKKLPDDASTPVEVALSSTLQDRWWDK